ncbi:peptide chain release factor N(5)-glutamine methyltransferase [Bacteroides sp.]|uniref:peptide chain release factor N(5)-glutamine methyltransferase n=1 Tax=Bacteroides sp. TaxID=29523 RepID=UPI002633E32D|nr:peptide chain release factor N(5)-glutamine methyltransferase [Bacteroides sp.]MDD3038539.1 peptide chain release factor N(5)-glutamine methyltransferase [Bacteroides sp.]
MNHIINYISQSLKDIYPPEEVKALSMMICCDILGLDALDIYMGKDITLSECKQHELENIIFRLHKNEPIQYIRGIAEFCGRPFRVASGVLVPRPETAELVDLIVKENACAKRILDIGTGSGCISISLSKELPDTLVKAWDVSDEALEIARWNNESLSARVIFEKQDVLSDIISEQQQYDVIVSNPPYVTEKEKKVMEPNVLEWEPELALFVPDDDPLLFYRRIANLGQQLLIPGGRLYFEINQSYGAQMVRLLEMNHYHNIRVIKDLFENDRIVTANR